MKPGRPEFHENYNNPGAIEDGITHFPYEAIDGDTTKETTDRIVGQAIIQILEGLTKGDMTNPKQYKASIGRKVDALCLATGITYHREINRKYLYRFVDNLNQAHRLAKAIRLVFDTITEASDESKKAIASTGRIAHRTIALTWIVAPSLYEGISLHELAERLDIHKNTLSKYAADISRTFGYRSHGQSKGWNYNPDKSRLTHEEGLKQKPRPWEHLL